MSAPHSGDAVPRARIDVQSVAGPHLEFGQSAFRHAHRCPRACHQVQLLVLTLVELERERFAFADANDLAETAVRRRPAELVAPWPVDREGVRVITGSSNSRLQSGDVFQRR